MTETPAETPAETQSSGATATRAGRIADLYARGVQAAQRTFDPQRHLVYQPAADDATTRTYRQASSLPLAYALLRQGDAGAINEAAAIVEAVLASQVTAATNPHQGNWLWLADDPEVADLNAVQFVLRGLLPLLVDYGDQLPDPLLALCQDRVRLALAEEERIDVAPTYTNIHLMSLFALLVGSQWLDDKYFAHLARFRWDRWVRFTTQSGAPHEYNSPGYGAIDLLTLDLIHRYVSDAAVRVQARVLYERVWLHLALHIHVPTGQQAAPHCRSYWGQMQSGRTAVKDLLWRETGWSWLLQPGPYGGATTLPEGLDLALADLPIPDYLVDWLTRQDQIAPHEVRETASFDAGFDLTTYLTPTYALGTASRTYGIGTDCFYIEHQANHLMCHYTRPQGGWGMVYARYVVNDQHWGTLSAAPDRPKTNNFYDQGHFAGVQLHNKAIGLYALKPQHEEVHSLKTVIAFPSGGDLEQIWIDDHAVDLDQPLPQLQPDNWLIVVDGGVYIGVRPLEPSCLGHAAPITLERGPLDELWLSIYNYRGAPKRFWDYASLQGAFWRGNLRAGFIMEVAGRDEYPSAAAFLAHLRQSDVLDTTDDQFQRTVTYRSGDDTLTLQYDLWHTAPGARILNGRRYQAPNLASPLAVQGDSGDLRVGSARLQTHPQQVWLIAHELDPSGPVWVAVNPEDRPTPLRLATPYGVIRAGQWGVGRMEWRAPAHGKPTLHIIGLERPHDLSVPAGVDVIWTDDLSTESAAPTLPNPWDAPSRPGEFDKESRAR